MAFAHAQLDGRFSGGRPGTAVPRMLVRSARAGQVARALEAAWRADDAGALDDGRARRLEAAWHLRVALRDGDRVTGDVGLDHALLADLLRRAGDFDAAARAARRGIGRQSHDGVIELLGFQLGLAAAADSGSHHLGEALSA